MVVTTLTQLKQEIGWPYQRLCRDLGVPYGSFRRWKHRLEQGEPVRRRPGPKKLAPLRWAALSGDLHRLQHGDQRTAGSGVLYRQYQGQISRRELEALIATARRAEIRQRTAALRHVTWQVPGLVWALDDTELMRWPHRILRLHQVQDLASRYKFPPWVSERLGGDAVARHLEQLFRQYGVPLVLKRDNGATVNQRAIDAVLARYGVLPLNSPPHYPRYNGGVERAIRELKTPLTAKLLTSGPTSVSQLQGWAEQVVHALNHRPRRSLHGDVACRVFQEATPALKPYTLRKRREVFDEIDTLTQSLMESLSVRTPRQVDAVRRLAVEACLQHNGVISVTPRAKVSPVFLRQSAQN